MFCKNCGKEISDNAVVCPYCGVQVSSLKTSERGTTCGIAIVGFVFSFLMPLVGLICSIIGRKKCNEEHLEGGGLALAGIIISAISMGLALIIIIATIGSASCIAAQVY